MAILIRNMNRYIFQNVHEYTLCFTVFQKFASTSKQAVETVKTQDKNLPDNFKEKNKDIHDEWKLF